MTTAREILASALDECPRVVRALCLLVAGFHILQLRKRIFPPGLFISSTALRLPNFSSDFLIVLALLSDSNDLLEVEVLSDFSSATFLQSRPCLNSNDLLEVEVL